MHVMKRITNKLKKHVSGLLHQLMNKLKFNKKDRYPFGDNPYVIL